MLKNDRSLKKPVGRLSIGPLPFLGQLIAWWLAFSLAFVGLAETASAQDAAERSGESLRTVYFVLLDTSESMAHRPQNPAAESWLPKIDEVKKQLDVFLGSLPHHAQVRFYAFDKELVPGPITNIAEATERAALLAWVRALDPKGLETRLWRSLDTVLGEATRLLQEHPEIRIRVIAYSDGEDNETPVQTKPGDVLAKYQTLLTHSAVQLTYVTIGFELKAEVKQAFETRHVTVRKVLVPEDLIPLLPDFELSPTPARVGDAVQVLDYSLGVIRERTIDWGDGQAHDLGRSPSRIFRSPGDYTVKLEVVSSSGQNAQHTKRLQVLPRPTPVAALLIPERANVNQPVCLIDRCQGEVSQVRWLIDGAEVSRDHDYTHRFFTPGIYTVRVEASGNGGMSHAEQEIAIAALPPPIADFVVGVAELRVGDEVLLTDLSRGGEIQTANWFLPGAAEPIVKDYSRGEARSLAFTPQQAGEAAIRLVAKGPGGKHEITKTFPVHSRSIAPQAVVLASHSTGRGTLLVKFQNRSSGTIVRTEYDFGDGSQLLIKPGAVDAEHAYGPGAFTAHIRLVGADEFAPDLLEIPIHVAPPLPAYVKNWWWELPLGCSLLVGLIFGIALRQRQQEYVQQSLLTGTLLFKPKYSPLAPFSEYVFAGTNSEERIPLTDSCTAVVQLVPDESGWTPTLHLVDAEGQQHGPCMLTPHVRVELGDYEFQLIV